MKRLLHIRILLLAGFGLAVMLALVSCEDDEPEEIARVEYVEWYAAGDDVAPLFRAFPLNVDSIYLRFRVNIPNILKPDSVIYRMYMEKHTMGSAAPDITTGQDFSDWGALFIRDTTQHSSIIEFKTHQAIKNGSPVTVLGIYEELQNNDPLVMKMEYVYDDTNWPTAANALDGFGSTAGGLYGEDNIHTFTRLSNSD